MGNEELLRRVTKEALSMKEELAGTQLALRVSEERASNDAKVASAKARALERELSDAKNERLVLQEKLVEAEREASLHRMKRETMRQFRFKDVRDLQHQSAVVEEELRTTIRRVRDSYGKDVRGLKDFAGQQAKLIEALKNECLALGEALEETTVKLDNLQSVAKDGRIKLESSEEASLKAKAMWKLKTKKLQSAISDYKKEVAQLRNLTEEQKGEILRLNETVAHILMDRRLHLKENELLRQIQVPLPTGDDITQ